jgi:cyanophycinase-like exopeptidase
VTGVVALHGGAEFTAGDEPFLTALLNAIPARPLQVVIVPTAGARGRPTSVVDFARRSFERVAGDAGIAVDIDSALVVDEASANDDAIVRPLADANLVYLPGGDPDLIPRIFRDSRAWSVIRDAHERGAGIAGASAGAMALAPLTWTRNGIIEALGLVRGLIVVPHFASFDARGYESQRDALHAIGLGYLGLDERTGVIRDASGTWRVAGAGRAHWGPPNREAVMVSSGETLALPA